MRSTKFPANDQRLETKELPHGRRAGGSAWEHGYAQAFKRQSQQALVLIDRGRLISELGECWADQRAHHTASAVGVVTAGFVEHDNEQAVLLEDRVFDQ